MNFTKSSQIYNTATIKSTNDENKDTNVKSLIEIFFGHKIAQNYELFRDQKTSDVKPCSIYMISFLCQTTFRSNCINRNYVILIKKKNNLSEETYSVYYF